jgi:hypothetical protein
MLELRTHYQPQNYSIFFTPAAILVSNAVLRHTSEPTWRFWFLICMDYWKETAAKYPVMVQIAQACLSFAMKVGRITGMEARVCLNQIKLKLPRRELEEIETAVIFDFDQAISGTEGYRADELAKLFEELVMFDEFIDEARVEANSP